MTKAPSELDIAWAAGIYEGEGTCSGRLKHSSTEYISISQKDPWILYKLQSFWGGSVGLRKSNITTIYDWLLCGRRARSFMTIIMPFLSPRRQTQWSSCALMDEPAHGELTEDQVRQIKTELANGKPCKRLAQQFAVSRSLISLINTGKRWGWVR